MSFKQAQGKPQSPSIYSSPDKFAPTSTGPDLSSRNTFRGAVYARLNNPLVSLFRLGIRIFQLIFAIASGVSYALEISHGSTASGFIYSQIVFGLTLLTLIIDAITLRSYRLTFIVESILCVLWLALFGTFYQIYLSGDAPETEYAHVDFGRMKRAVWVDLINFLLWFASSIFSTAMCCSGTKAMIKGKVHEWKIRRERRARVRDGSRPVREMEEGIIREAPRAHDQDRLPLYEEIAALARSDG